MTEEGRVTGGLRPALYNPREITEERLALLGDAMRVFGDLGGIVYNRRTGTLVGGHQRIRCLPADSRIEIVEEVEDGHAGTVALGWVHGPDGERWAYREVEWDEDTERMANLAANKHGGAFVLPAVREILEDLDTGPVDLTLSGWTEEELAALMAPIPPLDEDEDKEDDADAQGAGGARITCPACGEVFER